MRTLTDHIVSGDQAVQLQIEVTDEPGAGGANHEYLIMLPPLATQGDGNSTKQNAFRISFQNGPIKEVGVNGITQEALLAIVIDRLRSFQSGAYACEANAFALSHCQSALLELQKRTRARIARGVEGTHAV